MPHYRNLLIPLVCTSITTIAGWSAPCIGVTPDNTLQNPTRINQVGNQTTINGGTQVGSNLFHSFSNFNIPTNNEVIFNANNISNIITRVTGANASNIDGIINVIGGANLYLLNPNGIRFGSNARLNVAGSFIASTASQLQFADGTLLDIATQAPTPLLTISAPVGLVFNNSSSSISVYGTGYQIRGSGVANIPILQTTVPSQLNVNSGKTLALIAREIELNGGTVGAKGGNVHIGTAQNETVKINTSINNPNSISFSYESKTPSGNINLINRAGINTSGGQEVPSGEITLRGREINIFGGSVAVAQNFNPSPGGDINVTAQTLNIRDDNISALLRAGIVSEAAGTGRSGDINVQAKTINLTDGSTITNRNNSSGNSGDVNIKSETLKIDGVSAANPARITFIGAQSGGDGTGGNTNIKTSTLDVTRGASISALVWNNGKGGNVNIEADRVSVIGTYAAPGFIVSAISASSLGTGEPGNINIDTKQLEVLNGGLLSTTIYSDAKAGRININASESVLVKGIYPGSTIPSQIRSSVSIAPSALRDASGSELPAIPQGESRSVTITSASVTVQDSARISVRNEGFGNSGKLEIKSENIQLVNNAELTATTFQGKGGDIFLDTKQLTLRNQSRITTNARGTQANGGNITINADTLLALENSDLTANSANSFGGRVIINTQGLIGIQYRLIPTPFSDIIASGGNPSLNGVVKINTNETDPTSNRTVLPVQIVAVPQISSQCSTAKTARSRFTITGRGGIPQNPTKNLLGQTIWNDLRRNTLTTSLNTQTPTEIIEADTLINQNGELALVNSRDDFSSC
ncbi:filamentous hemagglutinin-like protein [Calothrix sp. NIES-4071]|nr:filamentous hemagglutinin-like protein [Calothrix sp. NIES-4071]BAZ55948.1 filamentous hemagglutinin-like protein [Calothrix sp. NIES-4105]